MATIEQYGALMRSQLGVSEDPPGSNQVLYSAWYGVSAAWCQMFQNWAHVKLGMVPPGYDPAAAPKGSAYTPTCADWFRRRGRWSSTAHVGDLVYFDFPGDGVGRISHVGWVEAVNDDGSITTIEGNTDVAGGRTGGRVMRKVRTVGIVGYGRPDYHEEELMSAEGDRIIRELRGARGADLTDVLTKVEAVYNQVNVKAGAVLNGLVEFVGNGLVKTRDEVLVAIRALPTDTWPAEEREAFLAQLGELQAALEAAGQGPLDLVAVADALADNLAARLAGAPAVPTA